MQKRLSVVLVLLLTLIGQGAVLLFVAYPDRAPDTARAAGADYPNCRLGVGVIKNPIITYSSYPTMRFGWYVNWAAPLAPVKPQGMDFYHTLRVKQDKSGSTYLPTYHITPTLDFSPSGLGPIVQANPGSVWIIGNEPDRVYYQDESLPDMYATIYHDAYTFIKGIDPTARVAIGGVIQPTPVRLQYLDMVLSAYRSKYGSNMPIDVWNIHLYILRETVYSWGASIPPGISATTGTMYTIPQHVDINIFTSLVRAMRTWMKSRGYQDTPLIITEYGVLFPADVLASYGIDQADLNAFVGAAANYMYAATDTSIGHPADNYRLVQQAAIYSLDDDGLAPEGGFRWGGFLFRSTPPYTITAAGLNHQSIAQALTATVDLLPHTASINPPTLIVTPGGSMTTTLSVYISNAGNSPPPISTTVRFFDVTEAISVPRGFDRVAPFTGCGTRRPASVLWPDLAPGFHYMRVEVDPDGGITETLESNNLMILIVFVGTHGVYLPTVQR